MNKWLKQDLWRHIVALTTAIFALFPLYLVIISSFNSTGSLQITSFVPREISWNNYKLLFTSPAIPYLTWMKNSLVVAGSVALVSVVIGSASAFAFRAAAGAIFRSIAWTLSGCSAVCTAITCSA